MDRILACVKNIMIYVRNRRFLSISLVFLVFFSSICDLPFMGLVRKLKRLKETCLEIWPVFKYFVGFAMTKLKLLGANGLVRGLVAEWTEDEPYVG